MLHFGGKNWPKGLKYSPCGTCQIILIDEYTHACTSYNHIACINILHSSPLRRKLKENYNNEKLQSF